MDSDDNASTVGIPVIAVTPQPQHYFVLTVLAGPEAGKVFEVRASDPGPLLVGSAASCHIPISDHMVSRRHAELEYAGNHLRWTDARSKNGSFANGVQFVEVLLSGGEQIRIGNTLLAVEAVKGSAVEELSRETSFEGFIGASTEVRRLYPLLHRIATSDVPIIIEGETGTGKEVIAEAIHARSSRSSGPFVVFDCTAVAPTLVEAALFGHERGAFTGATSPRTGVFEEARGGTLLIDEIGDLDLSLQPKLLRAIERREVSRVGGHRVVKVDVRILAATRRDLDREIQAGRFRDDLFHRLAVGRVLLPPLRRRAGDVSMLAQHFCQLLGGAEARIPIDVLRKWEDHSWPGNTRELRNAVARFLALGDAAPQPATYGKPSSLGLAHEAATVDAYARRALRNRLPLVEARRELAREFDRLYSDIVLQELHGNATRTAEFLGVTRRYFHLLRQKVRIDT